MNYTDAVIKRLEKLGYNLNIVHRDYNKKSKYKPKNYCGVTFHNRSETNFFQILHLITEKSPRALVVSGWQDKTYLFLCFICRIYFPSMRIFMASDNQIKRTFKQKFMVQFRLYHFVRYFFFTNAWVSGDRQYAFAARMGYSDNQIITGLYSCDTELFHKDPSSVMPKKQFYFVGRLEKVKSFDLLIEAWRSLHEGGSLDGWQFNIVGTGSLIDLLPKKPSQINIKYHGEISQKELVLLLSQGGVYILPSRHEPWGVALHEAASMGMPILASKNVGSADEFLIHGYNGFILDDISVTCIKKEIMNFVNKNTLDLKQMALRSLHLSKNISPQLSAHKLHAELQR